jgi:beta-glucosidase
MIAAASIGATGAIIAALISVGLPMLKEYRLRHAAPGPEAGGTAADRIKAPAAANAATGLRGEYWNLPPFQRTPPQLSGTPHLTRIDPVIDFAWQDGVPAPAISADYFAARWTGQIHATLTGSYQFLVDHNDGARLLVNNIVVADSWRPGNRVRDGGYVYLEADRWYPIQLEMFEGQGPAQVRLSWRRPGADQVAIVAGEHLRPPPR